MFGHLTWHNAVNVKMARHVTTKIYSYIPELLYYVLLRETKQMFLKIATT